MSSQISIGAPMLCCLAALVVSPSQAQPFLGRISAVVETDVSSPTLNLVAELEATAGFLEQDGRRSANTGLLERLERSLRPMFVATPQGATGRLGDTSVSYLLHRLFVERHGWFVEGLRPTGHGRNSSSVVSFLRGYVPARVLDLLVTKLNSDGLDLQEVALVAATVEALVRGEASQRLGATYKAMDLSTQTNLNEKLSLDVLDNYMASYILGKNISHMTPSEAQSLWKDILEFYPTFDKTQGFVRKVRRSVLEGDGLADTSANTPLSTNFAAMARVIQEVGGQYGRWQNTECSNLKQDLVRLEEPGSGHVRLERFYGAALKGQWQFSEDVEYLRQLGALDESDARHTSVVIANYIGGISNCIASSNFYSVCCVDECEPLLKRIESEVAAPTSSPERIAEIVSALPSASVDAPRTLSATLLRRLDEVAAHHGGSVVLHGRLFAQWLHHAFPHECPFPHLSGTTRPLTVEQWMNVTGKNAAYDTFDLETVVDKLQRAKQGTISSPVANGTGLTGEQLPWLTQEELYVSFSRRSNDEPSKELVRGMMATTMAVCMVVGLIGQMLLIWRRTHQKHGIHAVTKSFGMPRAKAFESEPILPKRCFI